MKNISILFLTIACLIIASIVSLMVGSADITWVDIKETWLQNSETIESKIIVELRIPRVLAGVLVGVAMAIAGVIMQALTNNPLASPTVLGITDGAAFAIAIAYVLLPELPYLGLLGMSFLGAVFGAALVFGVGSMAKGKLTPVKLALAGAAVGALLHSLSSGMAIYFNVAQDVSFWFAGGLANLTWTGVLFALPFILIGTGIALYLARSLTVLVFGEETAIGLGQNLTRVRLLGGLASLLLIGSAVAIGGTIGFIGLVIPHITRMLMGYDHRWVIPMAGLFGALLLTTADIAARSINPPSEIPVGALTALIGVPYFLYLARRDGGGLR
ncbi:ferrichrome ABC transporter permease [Pontibacillus halophilus JSM 076056 = DSM 19796]|uniref:Ferrichrome ABC transporter permease n=1 Tax=Pontibacillus halophilus JSM 076056 = DSM 19796 TaxID=1385510 RepID=A0A0A5GIV7_9BACI|nr:iron ABC transporter permease [Pontibacillus halophilus]KGX91070.1 ferrichrome ABC transporter permease [Pontibacillus halophilus JSM 076056 = DSM 19796]